MIAYFDTSAIIPLVINEPATPLCQRIWHAAHMRATSLLSLVEAEAAIAQALRLARITREQGASVSTLLQSLWNEFFVIASSERIVRRAASLAHTQGLRGYDAVHCASALAIAHDDFLAASGDRKLIEAWRDLGLVTALAS